MELNRNKIYFASDFHLGNSSAKFNRLREKKIVLNQNILSNSDIAELEYEAGIKFFYRLPPLNDRKKNEAVTSLLEKIGIIKNTDKSETSKMIFGLFRR